MITKDRLVEVLRSQLYFEEDPIKVGALDAVLCAIDNLPDESEDKQNHFGNTMDKVYESLKEAGLDDYGALNAVNYMQNRGILFRERT